MKVLIAFNSFKQTASSAELNDKILKNLNRKGIFAFSVNISDGGDGFLDCFKNNCKIIKKNVTGPFYDTKVKSEYCIKRDEAFIEIAEICGIRYLKKGELDPINATTYGVGQIIKDAVKKGAKKIYIGLGGTASNDGGFGMARCLGAKFLDKKAKPIDNNIYGLLKLYRIDFSNFMDFSGIKFYGVSDVKNKLLGKYGSAQVFGPQKGATPKDIRIIEEALSNLSYVLKKETGRDISSVEGGASAGGLGAGVYGFLNGKLISGSDFIIKRFNIEDMIKKADVIITGEGKLDRSSFYGKITGEIIKIGSRFNKKVIFFTAINDFNKKIKGVDVIDLSKKYPLKVCLSNIISLISKELENLRLFNAL